jgi:hypothetical protein
MADLAEEVARIFGYNNIPSAPIAGAAAQGAFTEPRYLKNVCMSFAALWDIMRYPPIPSSVNKPMIKFFARSFSIAVFNGDPEPAE